MPSESGKQHRLMEAVAHDPEVAAKTGVPQKVAKEYVMADIGRKFSPKPKKPQGRKPK